MIGLGSDKYGVESVAFGAIGKGLGLIRIKYEFLENTSESSQALGIPKGLRNSVWCRQYHSRTSWPLYI